MKTKPIYIFAVIICAILLASAPAFATIVLEVHSETANNSTVFTDSTGRHSSITSIDGAKHTNANARGATSMFFDGTDDYLSMPDSPDWDFGANEFTIDFWVRLAVTGMSYEIVTHYEQGGGTDSAWQIYIQASDRVSLCVRDSEGNGFIDVTGATPLSVNTWHHVAISRNVSITKLFIDGDQEGIDTTSSGTINDSTVDLLVGAVWQVGAASTTLCLNGNLDDLYIRNGEALEQYQIVSIKDFGGEVFEAGRTQRRVEMTSALNNGGVNELALGYTESEINELADLYEDANGGLSPADVVIGDLTWSYLSGELPGDTGGTVYSIGDAYMNDGKWYMKLGSGLEGVPEVPKGPALIIAMLCLVCAVVRKKLVPDDGDRFNIENKGTGVD